MTITVDQVLEAFQTFGEPELEKLAAGLGAPTVARVPLDAIARLARAAAAGAQAPDELGQMRAAVAGADAAADVAEAEALAAQKSKA